MAKTSSDSNDPTIGQKQELEEDDKGKDKCNEGNDKGKGKAAT